MISNVPLAFLGICVASTVKLRSFTEWYYHGYGQTCIRSGPNTCLSISTVKSINLSNFNTCDHGYWQTCIWNAPNSTPVWNASNSERFKTMKFLAWLFCCIPHFWVSDYLFRCLIFSSFIWNSWTHPAWWTEGENKKVKGTIFLVYNTQLSLVKLRLSIHSTWRTPPLSAFQRDLLSQKKQSYHKLPDTINLY